MALACIRVVRLLAGLLVALPAAAGPVQMQMDEITAALRTVAGSETMVTLPDLIKLPAGTATPLHATYRATFRLQGEPRRLAMSMPGLIAHDRIRVNGHVVDDRMSDPMAPLPRSLSRIRFIEIAQEFVRAGDNVIEVEVAGRPYVSLSRINVGDRQAMQHRYEKRLLGAVIGPAFVAVVVFSLSLCVLLLWARRGDALYGYFGIGTLGWALHTAWSVLPYSIVTGVIYSIGWTSLYTFFVGMLVIFCVRFAGWQWPRFDRTVMTLSIAGPMILYLAHRAGVLGQAEEAWRLLFIGIVAVGLVAVGRFAWLRHDTNSFLLLLTGGVSLALGVRDFMVAQSGNDNNPIWLVPYAGLLFVVLVAWMLIDRFVAATRELAAMNRELEQRVEAKGAQLTKAVDEMRSAKESAEAANRSKSSFLAAASHDLRQPTHALGLYMATLADERLSSDQREVVQRMKTSLTALEAMFNSLLDISRMDAGIVVAAPHAFALAPLLHRLADEFGTQAAERALRLSVRIAATPTPVAAFSDPMLIERIMRNLIGNAVKYTEHGGILVSARLRGASDVSAGRWRVEVWDTGPGIAEEDRMRVFEEFFQVGNAERDRTSGLGLGLSIVRRLTDLLEHPLQLTSQVGRGSRFAFDLPATQEVPSSVVAPLGTSDVAGLCVAVVDDDPEVRGSTELLLRRWGCVVVGGADGDDVVLRQSDAAANTEAIVADYRLRGEMTGIDAINAVRAAARREVPALIVSGESSIEQLARLRASGFDCMSKPVSPALLREWLAEVVRARSTERGSAEAIVSGASAP